MANIKSSSRASAINPADERQAMAKTNVIAFPLSAMAVNERAIKQRAAKRERTIGSKGYEDCRTELLDAHMRLMRIHFDGLPVAEWDIWQRKVGEAAGHRLLF